MKTQESKPFQRQTHQTTESKPDTSAVGTAYPAQLQRYQALADQSTGVRQLKGMQEVANAGKLPGIQIAVQRGFIPGGNPQAVMQRVLAVQVLEDGGKVSDIAIQGRPHGVLKGEEGSHTTAWVVSTEGVRNEVIGQTFQNAVKGVLYLADVAQNLPGYKRKQNQTIEKEDELAQKEQHLQNAGKVATKTPNALTLQHLVHAYLSFRNAIPLSAVKLGATADGKGESKWIKVLYDYKNQAPKVLQEAFLSLIDYGAIVGFGDATSIQKQQKEVPDEDAMATELNPYPTKQIEHQTFLDAPGVTPEDYQSEQVITDVLNQHLMSVKASFPAAYEKAGLGDLELKKVYSEIRKFDELHKEQKHNKEKVNFPVVNKAPSKPKTAVQIDMGDNFNWVLDYGKRPIQSMAVEGRPRGVFGSEEKSHTTAWSVVAQGPVTACVGKILPNAYLAMAALSKKAWALPQIKLQKALPKKQKEEFKLAGEVLNSLLEKAQNTYISVDLLQRIVVAYLNFKNLMPFSAVDLGKKANNHNEQGHLDTFRDYQNKSKEELQTAIWGMLDRETMVDIGIGAAKVEKVIRTKEEVFNDLLEEASKKQELSGKRRSRSSSEFKDLPKLSDVEPELSYEMETKEETHKRLPGVPHPSEYVENEGNKDKAERVGMVIGNHLKNIELSFPQAFAKADLKLSDVENYVGWKFGDKIEYGEVALVAKDIVKHFL